MGALKKALLRSPAPPPSGVVTHRARLVLRPEWEWLTRDGDEAMNVRAPYDAVTGLYGHIHTEHHDTIGHAQHYAARSLIFAFPDPTAAEKKPLPFDNTRPFHNLSIRTVTGPSPVAATDVELTMRELSGTEGVVQMLKGAHQ
mgnify:CR=1 FL=1